MRTACNSPNSLFIPSSLSLKASCDVIDVKGWMGGMGDSVMGVEGLWHAGYW
jgi:hypothetical protein